MTPTTTERSPFSGRGWIVWSVMAAVVAGSGGWVGVLWQQQAVEQHLAAARKLTRSDERQAAEEYRRYLQFHPRDAAVRVEFAKVLRRRDPEGALQELRKIPATDALHDDAVRLTAALAIDQGRDYDAVGPLRHLSKRIPDDAGVQLALAQLRFRERDFEAALIHAQSARSLNPKQPEAWLVEAESLDELKRTMEMVEPLQAVLAIDTEIPQAHLNLAFAYQLVGREEEALKHAEWFLQRFPQSAAGLRTLALIQRSRGEHEAALTAVKKSLELRPNQLDAEVLEAELLLFLRRSEEAYQVVSHAYQSHGPERRVLTLLIRAALLTGRRDESQDWQRRLTQLGGLHTDT